MYFEVLRISHTRPLLRVPFLRRYISPANIFPKRMFPYWIALNVFSVVMRSLAEHTPGSGRNILLRSRMDESNKIQDLELLSV